MGEAVSGLAVVASRPALSTRVGFLCLLEVSGIGGRRVGGDPGPSLSLGHRRTTDSELARSRGIRLSN